MRYVEPLDDGLAQLFHHLVQLRAFKDQALDLKKMFMNFLIGAGHFDKPLQFAFQVFLIVVHALDEPTSQTQRSRLANGQVFLVDRFDLPKQFGILVEKFGVFAQINGNFVFFHLLNPVCLR